MKCAPIKFAVEEENKGKSWGTRIALQRRGMKIKNQKVKEILKKRERTKTGGNTDFFAKRRENKSRRN